MNNHRKQTGLRALSPCSNSFSRLHGNPELQEDRGGSVLPLFSAGTDLSWWEFGGNGSKTFIKLATCVSYPLAYFIFYFLKVPTHSSARMQEKEERQGEGSDTFLFSSQGID